MPGARLYLTLLVLLSLTVTTPATAQDGREQEIAQTLKQAQAHYDAGEFRQAIPLLNSAYDALKAPVILYRLGNVYHGLGNFQRARTYYEEYLELDPETELRGRVETKVETLRRLEATSQGWAVLHMPSDDDEVFYHNDLKHPVGTADDRIPLAVGEHRLAVVSGPNRGEVVLEVGPGDVVERWVLFQNDGMMNVALEDPSLAVAEPEGAPEEETPVGEPEVTESPEVEEPVVATEALVAPDDSAEVSATTSPQKRGHGLAIVGGVVGFAGLGAIGFGAYNDMVRIPDILEQQQDVADAVEAGTISTSEAEAQLAPLRQDRQTAVVSGIIGYAAGATLLTTGLVLIAIDLFRPSTASETSLRVTPYMTASGAGVVGVF